MIPTASIGNPSCSESCAASRYSSAARRNAVNDAEPVVALRVVGDEHFHRFAVARGVLDLRAGIRQQLQWLLGGRLALPLLGVDVLHQLPGRAREVVAQVQRLEVDRAHRFFRAAVLEVARRQLGGLCVVFYQIVLAGGGREKLPPFPLGRGRRGGHVLEGARRYRRFARRRRSLPQDTLDQVVLVRRPIADGLCFAHLGERFLALFGFQELDRGLDGLADLGSRRLGARSRLLGERARGEQCDPERNEAKAGAHEARGPGLQRMNCSLPIRPIFVIPSRCAEANTIATLSYLTSLLGRRCSSGWTGMSAAARNCSSSAWRSGNTCPFQIRVPSKSTSTVTTTGGTGGGGGVASGMVSLTACVWIGIVMMSMMSRTSITSISGVVLMSSMTSGSRVPPPDPIFMAMSASPRLPRAVARRRLRDETDLQDPHALARGHHPADEFVARLPVAADVDFRLGPPCRDFHQPDEQHPFLRDELVVPEHVSVLVDGDDDVLGFGLRRLVSFLRQLDRHALDDHRNRDEEDDQQHEHDVDERGGVDVRDEIVFGVRAAYRHAHDSESLRVRPPRPSSDIWTPPPKCRTSSIATLLRRTSQL